ncbi:MAG: DsbA family oxidoreductase [Psychromonas sp.]
MSDKIKIDIISDVVCPWCVVGYKNLQKAIEQLDIADKVELQWQPFELNPNMPTEGQNLREHVAEKYGSSREESDQSRVHIRATGEKVGFTFNFFDEMKIVNTRDAHILLQYAWQLDKQTPLTLRLFSAFFSEKKDISDRQILLNEATKVGIEREQATACLQDAHYCDELIQQQAYWQKSGISAVPAVVFNRSSVLSGAQPIAAYREVLMALLDKNK